MHGLTTWDTDKYKACTTWDQKNRVLEAMFIYAIISQHYGRDIKVSIQSVFRAQVEAVSGTDGRELDLDVVQRARR
jgi:hypothetical protein